MRTIIENNKLIAEFMELELIIPKNKIYEPFYRQYQESGMIKRDCLISSLKYNLSWDWLMPVIDKIYSSNEYYVYKSTLGQFSTGIEINTKFIDVTYNNVVDYIKWYNSQTK